MADVCFSTFTVRRELASRLDSESYTWMKLDITKQSDRDIVTKYFTWEGDFGVKEVADGKVFK